MLKLFSEHERKVALIRNIVNWSVSSDDVHDIKVRWPEFYKDPYKFKDTDTVKEIRTYLKTV